MEVLLRELCISILLELRSSRRVPKYFLYCCHRLTFNRTAVQEHGERAPL